MGRYLTYRCPHCLLEARSGPGQMAQYSTRSVVCTTRKQIEEVMAENRHDHLDHGPLGREARMKIPGEDPLAWGGIDGALEALGIPRGAFEDEYRDCAECRIGWCRACGQRDHPEWTDEGCPRCGRTMVAHEE